MTEALPHAATDGYGWCTGSPPGRGRLPAGVTRQEVLDATLSALGAGQPLTLDVVAREAGVATAGVVAHFPTTELLALAVVDRLVDHWEAELNSLVEEAASPAARLRAYVVFTLESDLGPADLAVIGDAGLRRQLQQQWNRRLGPWFGAEDDPRSRIPLVAARLVADGAWLNRALGTVELDALDRAHVLEIALRLIAEAEEV